MAYNRNAGLSKMGPGMRNPRDEVQPDNRSVADCFTLPFAEALLQENGYALAAVISPVPPPNDIGRLYAVRRSTNAVQIHSELQYELSHVLLSPEDEVGLKKKEKEEFREQKIRKLNAWVDVFVAYWKALGEILAAEEASNQAKNLGKNSATAADWVKVYEAWRDVLNAVYRGYQISLFEAWTIPCLYTVSKYIRVFAIKADENMNEKKGKAGFSTSYEDDVEDAVQGNETLEDAGRQINKIFGICISDRAPLAQSRKWGLYYIANMLFKTHFRISQIALSKNILKSISAASGDMPPLENFPKSHQVTFNYYVGVIYFLEENYPKADEHLTRAYNQSLATCKPNIQLILTYLIPTRLVTSGRSPTESLLSSYPSIQRLFAPMSRCIKSGDLAGFDAALLAGEDEFVKRRIYLTLERGRDVCMRNLFRRVYLAGGYEEPKDGQTERLRRSRILIQEFLAAMRVMGEMEMDKDEVECMLANMIYKALNLFLSSAGVADLR